MKSYNPKLVSSRIDFNIAYDSEHEALSRNCGSHLIDSVGDISQHDLT
jgi:hypothetical protein